MKFKLLYTMAQWDKNHTLYVVLPTGTEGETIRGIDHTSEVRFELYPALTFIIDDDIMEKLNDVQN